MEMQIQATSSQAITWKKAISDHRKWGNWMGAHQKGHLLGLPIKQNALTQLWPHHLIWHPPPPRTWSQDMAHWNVKNERTIKKYKLLNELKVNRVIVQVVPGRLPAWTPSLALYCCPKPCLVFTSSTDLWVKTSPGSLFYVSCRYSSVCFLPLYSSNSSFVSALGNKKESIKQIHALQRD